ncbi:hypothetical protein EVG20_g2416 [Dentipellis fragilis]|uniref:Uncharacterized protein n=1 Tax=Dentipellis fragilis TaxID=205917 RepID=A0A4Y9Z9U7_9AGAM|nr:hypothetical protein EVG20_g2416 [Dentipellis fragilis]
MRPDDAKVPTEDELKTVEPFTGLPECLLPTLRSEPPHLEYGFPISDAQLVAFARLYRPNDTVDREPRDTTDGPTSRTLGGASTYLSAAIGCRVEFRDVWNAAPEEGAGGQEVTCWCVYVYVSVCDSGSRADVGWWAAQISWQSSSGFRIGPCRSGTSMALSTRGNYMLRAQTNTRPPRLLRTIRLDACRRTDVASLAITSGSSRCAPAARMNKFSLRRMHAQSRRQKPRAGDPDGGREIIDEPPAPAPASLKTGQVLFSSTRTPNMACIDPHNILRPNPSLHRRAELEYAVAAMRAQVPAALHPPCMRADRAQPVEEELVSVPPFTLLPQPLFPYSTSSFLSPPSRPPHFEYGFPITEEQVIDFWKRKEPDSLYGSGREPFFDGALDVRTFTPACEYLSAELGWVVLFKFVCNATADGGHVISLCDSYEAVLPGGRPEQRHVAKLRELLALPPEAKPKWYINAAECEWT